MQAGGLIVSSGKIRVQQTGTVPLSSDARRAFEDFYSAHYPLALRYLTRMLQNADDAYDVLTHSFELALNRFDEYLNSSDNRYWFFGILRNTASYFMRRRSEDRNRVLPMPRATPTPEELLLRGEEDSLIDRALAALPAKYREVAVLRFQEMSYKEIAAALCLSVEAVESRMRRAIIKLEPFYAEFKAGHK